MLSEDTVVVAVSDQISSKLADETIILHFDVGRYYGLNLVGTRIWTLIQKPVTVRDVVTTLLGEFDVTPEACAREVHTFLGRLHESDLLSMRTPAGVRA